MTVDELFAELEGSFIMVDGQSCYPQFEEGEDGASDSIEMLDGDLILFADDIKKIVVHDYHITVTTNVTTHVIEVYEVKCFKEELVS